MHTDQMSDLLKTYGDTAYRMALRLTAGREAEARDLVQDAFLKIWRAENPQELRSIEAWLYCILRNLHIDRVRRKARLPTFSLDAPGPTSDLYWADTIAEKVPSLAQEMESKELGQIVRCALGGLPPDYRIPVILCDMEGLSYQEIAQSLACPVGTVRSRIHRGRRELRRALVPVLAAVTTAIGAWFLCRAQARISRLSTPPVMVQPNPKPEKAIEIGFHRELPMKGESREHQKS
jgi:RNA polymerase sigma-70 factor (ECF subfamily)